MSIFLSGQTDHQQVVALNRCRVSEMKPLIELFTKLHEETTQALVKADEPSRIYRLQGRAEVLKDFLEAVDKAPSVLERTR